MSIVCTYYNPLFWVKFTGLTTTPPTLGTDSADFQFQSSTCYGEAITSTNESQLYIENPSSTLGGFFIEKHFTYGEITLGFFFLIFLFIFLLYVLKKLFLTEETTLHTIHKKIY